MEIIKLPLGECESTFKLEKAVCNHGFFMMAPNIWDSCTNTLQRPLRLDDSDNSVLVSISHTANDTCLSIRIHNTDHVSSSDQQAILAQVARMLRISNKDEMDVQNFKNIHPKARMADFGRLFRSPTLFEDLVKCLLLCNCGFGRALTMVEDLCKLQSILITTGKNSNMNSTRRKRLKRKQASDITNSDDRAPCLGNFPTSKELASLDEDILNKQCKLGYRARLILNLAKNIESGKIKLSKFDCEESSNKLYKKLMKIEGFGPYTCNNVLMCLGFYQKVPVDTETIRHLREVHARVNCNKKNAEKTIKQIYGKYAPFQCLAYWLELLEYYESKIGKLSELPKSNYCQVTGFLCNKK